MCAEGTHGKSRNMRIITLENLFVDSTSQSVRIRSQPSVELSAVPGKASIQPDCRYNSIEARTWEPPSVPQRRLLDRGMPLPMLTCSWTKCWPNSRLWQGMVPGRCDRGQSRPWPERRCARPPWQSGVFVSVACSGERSDGYATSPSAHFTDGSSDGPGSASGAGCSTGCAAPGGVPAGMLLNRVRWSDR
jgi:hypothetical protein